MADTPHKATALEEPRPCIWCSQPAEFRLEIVSAGYPVVCYFCTQHAQWVLDNDYMVIACELTPPMARKIQVESPAKCFEILPAEAPATRKARQRSLWSRVVSFLRARFGR